MERTIGAKRYKYTIVGKHRLAGETNMTLGVALRVISVKNEEKGAIYQLKQEKMLLNRLVKTTKKPAFCGRWRFAITWWILKKEV